VFGITDTTLADLDAPSGEFHILSATFNPIV